MSFFAKILKVIKSFSLKKNNAIISTAKDNQEERIKFLLGDSELASAPLKDLPEYSSEYKKHIFYNTGCTIKNGAIYSNDSSNLHISIENGLRKTVANPEKFENTIYIFGSSVAYCFGAEDKHTIASFLQEKINKAFKLPLRVLNYGVKGIAGSNMFMQLYSLKIKPNDSIIAIVTQYDANIDNGNTLLAMQKFCKERQAYFIIIIAPRLKEIRSPSNREHILFSNSFEELNNGSIKKDAITQNNYIMPQIMCELIQNGCLCVDLQPFFDRPHDLGEIFFDNPHLCYKGNERIAEIILSLLPSNNEKRKDVNIIENGINDMAIVVKRQFSTRKDVVNWINNTKEEKFNNFTNIGAVVMNCNPFTYGHLHLIEYALSQCEGLYLFVVEEDRSDFTFVDRLEMIKQGTKHLSDKLVIKPSGKFIISTFSFPGYFSKSEVVEPSDSTLDIVLFGSVLAPALNISKRFVGEEPTCVVTAAYNEQMKFFLPPLGIAMNIISRKKISDETISASIVRKALKEQDYDKLKTLVPPTTYTHLKMINQSK